MLLSSFVEVLNTVFYKIYLLMLLIFESVPNTTEFDVFDGVFRPSDPPTVALLPPTPTGVFPEVTVIEGVSDEGEGIAGGGLDVTY
jgi:hypothetical protein